MHPKTRLILVASVVGVLVIVPVLAIALGVGLGVGLRDDGSNAAQVDPLVVQATSISFGSLTPIGRGGVRLSAQDSNVFAAPFRGLGLLPSTSRRPAFWRITPVGMNNVSASHWTVASGLVSEGVNATTPVPSAAGDAADLNLGPYKFLIEAFTADRIPYKSANLTINIVNGAMNLGTYDSTSTYLPRTVSWSSFTGDSFLLSTGIDRTNITSNFVSFNPARRVTFKHADQSRPGGIIQLAFTNSSNVLMTGIHFTGDLNVFRQMQGVVSFGAGTSNMAATSCNATFSYETANISAALYFGGCINCEVTDFYAFGMDTGFSDRQNAININITITRFRMRQFWNNAIWIGNAQNLTFIDCTSIAPMRFTGMHLDHIQVADGSSPQGLKVIRHQMYQAEGNGGCQGFFGGSPGIYQGYIDDNSTFGTGYSGRAGNVLTITNATNWSALVPVTPLMGSNFPGQLVRVVSAAQSGLLGQYVIDRTLNAPPGRIHTAPFNDLTISGLAYAGWMRNVLYLRGLGGKSTVGAYTASFLTQQMSEVPWTIFKGSISGTTLTVTEFVSGSDITTPMTIQRANGAPVNASSATGPRVVLLKSARGHEGTYELDKTGFDIATPILLRASGDIPNQPNQGPAIDILGVDIPALYPALSQSTISNLYMWTSYPAHQPSFRGYVGGPDEKPASVTVDSATTLINTANSTVASLSFAQGDPRPGLERLNHADWAKLSFDEVVARHVTALTPRVGGPLTSGTKDMGAFTRTAIWNDGSGKKP